MIADDHAIFREGLKALLELHPDIKVVGEVDRADDLKQSVVDSKCALLLLDLQMDRWVMDEIADLAKMTKVVVLTGSDREEDIVDSLRLGARAIVQKTFAADTVIEAIRAVASDMVWMPKPMQHRLSQRSQRSTAAELTPREAEIARLVAVGMRNAEVSSKLSIAEGTVKIHLNNIFRKLNIRDRVELTHYAIRHRLIAVRDSK